MYRNNVMFVLSICSFCKLSICFPLKFLRQKRTLHTSPANFDYYTETCTILPLISSSIRCKYINIFAFHKNPKYSSETRYLPHIYICFRFFFLCGNQMLYVALSFLKKFTQRHENSVSKNFHSRERFRKVTSLITTVYTGCIVGGKVASRWTPDRAVRVRALAGALQCVLGQDTLFS